MLNNDISIAETTDLDDFKQLLHIFHEVFEMEDAVIPSDEHLRGILHTPTFNVLLAKIGDRIVGGLTFHILPQYYTPIPQVYLYDLGVTSSFQRRGIGSMLIAALKDYCKKHGIEEFYVQADQDDTQAVNFYRLTIPSREADVLHFTYSDLLRS
jgi:aminoglycoside 3-N-acetyltransferase I